MPFWCRKGKSLIQLKRFPFLGYSMDGRQLLLVAVLSITSYVCAENGQHTGTQ